MNKTVVDSITDMFVNRQVIEQNDVNIYRYGVEVLVLSLFEVTSLLAVAFFVGNFFETVVFFLLLFRFDYLPVVIMLLQS